MRTPVGPDWGRCMPKTISVGVTPVVSPGPVPMAGVPGVGAGAGLSPRFVSSPAGGPAALEVALAGATGPGAPPAAERAPFAGRAAAAELPAAEPTAVEAAASPAPPADAGAGAAPPMSAPDPPAGPGSYGAPGEPGGGAAGRAVAAPVRPDDPASGCPPPPPQATRPTAMATPSVMERKALDMVTSGSSLLMTVFPSALTTAPTSGPRRRRSPARGTTGLVAGAARPKRRAAREARPRRGPPPGAGGR